MPPDLNKMVDINLVGKVVVITGASGRLGRRLVQGFAEYGATIAAIVRDEEQAREIPFPDYAEGWAFRADLTSERNVEAVFNQITTQLGPVDVLLHAIGIWEETPLLTTTGESWDRILRVNLTSAFYCFREATRHMNGDGARLIAFASGQGADRGVEAQGAYAAAKAGIIRLVESTAAEFRETNLLTYAVAPSVIRYDEGEEYGVAADDLVNLCLMLCSNSGAALSGETLRAYGNV